ncbi:hypothetical protein PG993_009847 [Apiospora rasikravindrae]|uniref:Uncharacterized protein n=1 Tax=Apiospora rasikravindrae TaxID=990691 RepID=A0ABR1SKX5_9PEZI
MPAFPSFHERRETDQPARLTAEALRLYWTLQDPLADALSVMRPDWREKGCAEREPYTTTANPALHAIAAAPLTEPKIGSITVKAGALDEWEENWWLRHEEDRSPDQVRGPPPPDYEPKNNPERFWKRSDENKILLLRCCGEDRPTQRPQLAVVPSDPDAGFVTVHDYVSAVHPWLMGLRDTIARADNVDKSKPAEYYDKMMVEHLLPDYIETVDESHYVGPMRAGTDNQPKHPSGESQLSQLVAKAEAGDLDAAQEAIMVASLQAKDPGLSPQILQALQDRDDKAEEEEIERQVQRSVALWKQSNPDASPAEVEAEAAHFRAPYLAMREEK